MKSRVLTLAALATAAMTAVLVVPARAQDPAPAERICDEVLVDMSDGVRLHTWVRRLPPDQPRPVLIEMESYARPGNACPDFVPGDYHPHLMTQETQDRFTIVHVSLRGTGSSEGLFDVMGPDTQRDIHEIIAWTRTQPWSDGRVVLTGGSGTGFHVHHGLREPGVILGLMLSSCADMYRCFRRGGAYDSLADVYIGVSAAGYQDGLDDRQRLGTTSNPTQPEQVAAYAQMDAETKARSTFDDWWADRTALPSIEQGVDVPVIFTTDPYDIVQPWEAFQLIPGARLNFAGGHTSQPVIDGALERYDELIGSAVDRTVRSVVFGEGDLDPDLITLVTTLGTVDSWRAAQALVRSEPTWPLQTTDWTRLYLAAGPSGSAQSINDGTLSLDAPTEGSSPAGTGDTAPLISAPGPRADFRTVDWIPGGAAPVTDFRDEEADGLTWTSPVLDQAVEVTGPIQFHLWADATTPDADWAVRLTSVQADGASEWVSDGYLRASLRLVDDVRSQHNAQGDVIRAWHPFTTTEPPPAGEPVEYFINVIPTSAVFPAGTRIRLDLLPVASAPPDAPAGAGTVTVLRDAEHPSSVLLPVIPRGCDRSVPLLEDQPVVTPCAPSYAAAVGELPTRTWGIGRVETAVEVSREAFPDGAPTVVLARADEYADALAGAPLAASVGGPILLTSSEGLSPAAEEELERLAPQRVVLLGGTVALRPQVEADVSALLPAVNLQRVEGPNRFATAAAIANEVTGGQPGPVFLVEGEHADPSRGWPDALAVAPEAARTGRPILLTNAERLPPDTVGALAELADEIVVVGGETAVSGAVADAAADATGNLVRRIAGATRYETAKAVHDEAVSAGADATRLWLATGVAFPDALAAGPAVGALGEAFMLVDGDDLDACPPTREVLQEGAGTFTAIRLLGGHVAISDHVAQQIRALLSAAATEGS